MSYHEVRLIFFNKFAQTPCDVFLKLAEDKFVKVLHKGAAIDEDLLRTYLQKKIRFLHVTESDFLIHKEKILAFSFGQDKNGQTESMYPPAGAILDEVLGVMGVDPQTQNQVHDISQKIVTTINSSPKMLDLLSLFLKGKHSFVVDHSYLVGVVAVMMANRFDWITSQMREKICLAAIFHDVALRDDAFARLEMKFNTPQLTPSTQMQLMDHVEEIIEKVAKIPDIPVEVSQMISLHHSYESNAHTQLTTIFLVAHEYVLEIYRNNIDETARRFAVDKVRKLLHGAAFDKAIKCLDELVNS
jgi:HD-GYP domain-containing protein (c-di-GMP phosphodiesterase class II)